MHTLLRLSRQATLLAIVLIPVSMLAAQEPSMQERHKAMIAQAVQLHDKGHYEAAIGLYKKILAEDPDNVSALYEASYTYFAMKDYNTCVDLAERGTKLDSDLRPALFMSLANCQDALHRPEDALATYERALKVAPDNYLIHYNLGVTYATKQEFAKARAAFERGVALKPAHASGHIHLAQVYSESGYPVPTILALSVFLLMEKPDSPRAKSALATLQTLLSRGLSKGDKKNGKDQYTITIEPSGKNDEGDFGVISMSLGIAAAANTVLDKAKPTSEFGKFASPYRLMTEVFDRAEREKDYAKGFAALYYVPFFKEVHHRGFVTALAARLSEAAPLKRDPAEEKELAEKSAAFDLWFAGYVWPTPATP